jgi:hypothetical protein
LLTHNPTQHDRREPLLIFEYQLIMRREQNQLHCMFVIE